MTPVAFVRSREMSASDETPPDGGEEIFKRRHHERIGAGASAATASQAAICSMGSRLKGIY